MEKVDIKQLEKSHIPEVRQLFSACNDYFQLIDGVSVCGCRAETEFELVLAQTHGKIFGIYIEGKLAGVLFIVENHPSSMQLTITLLLLEPNFRNRNIGNSVLEYVEKEAHENGFTSIVVGVDEVNMQAIAFWKKQGFVETGKRKLYQHVMRAGDIIYFEKVLAK